MLAQYTTLPPSVENHMLNSIVKVPSRMTNVTVFLPVTDFFVYFYRQSGLGAVLSKKIQNFFREMWFFPEIRISKRLINDFETYLRCFNDVIR